MRSFVAKKPRSDAASASSLQKSLPPRKMQVLHFIVKHATIPTIPEITAHMGWRNDSSTRDCIQWLATEGWLELKITREPKPSWRYGPTERGVAIFEISEIDAD